MHRQQAAKEEVGRQRNKLLGQRIGFRAAVQRGEVEVPGAGDNKNHAPHLQRASFQQRHDKGQQHVERQLGFDGPQGTIQRLIGVVGKHARQRRLNKVKKRKVGDQIFKGFFIF